MVITSQLEIAKKRGNCYFHRGDRVGRWCLVSFSAEEFYSLGKSRTRVLVVGVGGDCLDKFPLLYPPLCGRRLDKDRNTASKDR